jgi:drug/metabolite transporter (DMT)-like permease
MPSETVSARLRVARYVAFGGVILLATGQFYAAEPRPWGAAAAWAVGTALVFGPVAWLARARVPEERRETLTYVAAGVGILTASVWLGVSLAFAPALFPYGPGVWAGATLGVLVALLAERTVVPERMRGAGV